MDAQALAETQQDHTRISVLRLTTVIAENRAKHEREFNEAIKGWRARYAEECLTIAVRLELDAAVMRDNACDHVATEFETHFHLPPKPKSHLTDYDRVLKRLDMTLDEEWWLSNTEFNRYVLDDWEWKRDHVATMTQYSTKANVR